MKVLFSDVVCVLLAQCSFTEIMYAYIWFGGGFRPLVAQSSSPSARFIDHVLQPLATAPDHQDAGKHSPQHSTPFSVTPSKSATSGLRTEI